ncbi:hypothetical protein [Rhodococcus sp. JG-3]|nr:hypothetical protein [Rhodococcus sp. JG-3]
MNAGSSRASTGNDAAKRAGESRMRHSRNLIVAAGDRLADAGELQTMTMKNLALEAGVSVNTIKRQFPTIHDVVAAIVAERDRGGREVPSALRVQSDRIPNGQDREFAAEQLRILRALDDLPIDEAVTQTRDIYTDTLALHPHEEHLLAAQCCYLSYRLLQLPDDADRVDEALKVAERGIRHLRKDRGRHYALGGQLARNAAAAAQRNARIVCQELGSDPSTTAILEAKLRVLAQLSAVATHKQTERDYEGKLNQPVNAAAAEFHRARAEALVHQSPPAEFDAVLTMARTMREHAQSGLSLPPRILVPFLTRLCAVHVAYATDNEPLEFIDAEELLDLRDHLLNTLALQHRLEAETPRRALETMFALADRVRGDVDTGQDIHLPDLILLCGYGVIGQLLVADYLFDLAKTKDDSPAQNSTHPLNTSTIPLLEIKRNELFSAAKMYYTEAPKNTLIVGAAAVLAARARKSLAELEDPANDDTADIDDAKPWAVLKDGRLNAATVNQLSLGIATGQRPSAAQASAMLRELQPLLLTLRTIAGEEVKPDENGALETIFTAGLRFH